MPYIRFLFDAHTNHTLSELTRFLEQKYPGSFISQLSPEAKLGCHPFHITVCGGLHRYLNHTTGHYSLNTVLEALRTAQNKIQTPLTCSIADITSKGTRVTIGVRDDNGNVTSISQSICAQFQSKNDWYASNFHITLGIYSNSLNHITKEEINKDIMNYINNAGYRQPNTITICSIEFETDTGNNPPSIHLTPSVQTEKEISSGLYQLAFSGKWQELFQRKEYLSPQTMSFQDEKGYTILMQAAWWGEPSIQSFQPFVDSHCLHLLNYRGEKATGVALRRLGEEPSLHRAEVALKVLEMYLSENIWSVKACTRGNFSFLKVNKIVPYPEELLKFMKLCVETISMEQLLGWLENTNPFREFMKLGSILSLNYIAPLVVEPLKDIHVSLDTPPLEAQDKEYNICLKKLMVYPLGIQKIGVSNRKIGKVSFYPLAWCTVLVEILNNDPPLVPRDHSNFHLSFAQIGYYSK